MNNDIAINYLDGLFKRVHEPTCERAWQTLKTIVLAQQQPTSQGMPCCPSCGLNAVTLYCVACLTTFSQE